jgi:hypothetical protein
MIILKFYISKYHLWDITNTGPYIIHKMFNLININCINQKSIIHDEGCSVRFEFSWASLFIPAFDRFTDINNIKNVIWVYKQMYFLQWYLFLKKLTTTSGTDFFNNAWPIYTAEFQFLHPNFTPLSVYIC